MRLRSRTATALALSFTALSSWGCRFIERPASTTPGLDACAVALAPAAGEPTTDRDRAIERLKQDARMSVDSRDALEGLAYRYVARARAANDPGDYTLAERTATCLAGRYPDAASAWEKALAGDGRDIDRTKIEQKIREARSRLEPR